MSRRLRVVVLLSLCLLFFVAVLGVVVYDIHSPLTAEQWNSTASTTALCIDLNTATESELCQLPGVGTVLAQRILAYRDTVGAFRSVDELAEVSGISDTRLAAWRPFLTV